MKQKPSKEDALSQIFLVKAHTANQGRIYLPASLIGKRVMLQEVELPKREKLMVTLTGLWICPFCNKQLRVKERDVHIEKEHPTEIDWRDAP